MIERNLLQQIGRTGRAMHAAFEAEVGIPLTRWRILQSLSESEKLSQKALSSRLSIDPGLLTRQLKQMEAESLVKRKSSKEDNRMTLVELTEKGASLFDSLQEKRARFSEKSLSGLPGEKIGTAIEILKAIEERFRR
ncbi:MAG TPA: MarR family transcriptional regulator [Burkholderiales bacterium]|nr:MarR family transcriptional regulator [Burkholderiales bacterium]